VQAPLIDSILADIGVEGGSLAKMPGLIREARDMQGIGESSRRGGGDKSAKPPAEGSGGAATGEGSSGRSPRKKES
jgi:hypothetical protein